MTNNKSFIKAIEDRDNYIKKNPDCDMKKKLALDILMKYLITLINSFGKKQEIKILFMDEIKNKNMNNNLYKTKERIDKESKLINFYNFNFTNTHVKIGMIKSFILIIFMLLQSVILILLIPVLYKSFAKILMYAIHNNFKIYLKCIDFKENSKVLMMSDHHYFGAIVSSEKRLMYKSIVLQHGAICDKSYFYPIYADNFYAWGKESKKLLNNDLKVICTGTYKFEELIEHRKVNKYKDINEFDINILWPIRPISQKDLNEQFLFINEALNNLKGKIRVIIKKHPSSLSNFDFINCEKDELNFNIEYVNEDLKNISFDFAIIDNSTIGFDLIALGKPFAVLNRLYNGELSIEYEKYGIEKVSIVNELEKLLNRIINEGIVNTAINHQVFFDNFIENQLNHNECLIEQYI
jgi:hypothetical protein